MRNDREHLSAPSPWTDADVAAWKHVCDVHGVDALLLLKCAAHESGCSPSAVHKFEDKDGETHYGAAGLIQVEPENLSALGFHGTPLEFAQLTVEAQCRFNGNYLGWFPAMKGKGLAGVYCGLFLPALIAVAEAHPDEPLCGKHGPFAEFYEGNEVFDSDEKGYICGADLVRAAEGAFAACAIAKDVAARLGHEPETFDTLPHPVPPVLDIPGMNAPVDPPVVDGEPLEPIEWDDKSESEGGDPAAE